MSSSIWRRLVQFRLRTLLVAFTLLILAGNGLLIWWRTPFFIERRTASSSWEHVQILSDLQVEAWRQQIRNAREKGDLQGATALQATRPPPPRLVFREKSRVYRNLSGEHVRHGPFEIFDDKGALLRVENWVHGKLHGPWKDLLPDGRELCWGEYEQGEKHGRWVTLDLSIKWRFEDEYSHGVRRLHERFDENGLVWRTKYDETDSRVEETRWDPSRTPPALVLKTKFSIDSEGAQIAAFEGKRRDGGYSLTGQTRDGLEVGEWVFWNEDGSVNRRIAFIDGRLVHDGEPSPPIVPVDQRNRSSSVWRIAQALDDECGFSGQPELREFAAVLADSHQIPVRIEARALQKEGIPSDITLSFALPAGISLRAELQLVLRDAGLAPIVRRDVLLITTPEDAAHWRDETGLPEILSGPESPLRESLQQITTMRLQEAALKDLFALCRDQHQISIRPDESEFADAKAVLQTPVTVDLQGISLIHALGFVLDDCGLCCVEKDGEVLVRRRNLSDYAKSVSGPSAQ